MEKNNGKIAIAIVAMFVIALSIVGFTYAYFVATVQGNDDTNVKVSAGILEVQYTTDAGSQLTAYNLVPGWKNDGLHYYSATGYNTEIVEGVEEKRYESCVIGSSTDPAGCDDTTVQDLTGVAAQNVGKVGPLTFSVSATSRNTGDATYAIIFNSINNGLNESDQTNFTYKLICEECDVDGEGNPADSTIGTGTLNPTGVAQVISDVRTLGKNESESYRIDLEYANITSPQSSTGVGVSAVVEVIGVVEDADGNYVDSNGVIIIPKE